MNRLPTIVALLAAVSLGGCAGGPTEALAEAESTHRFELGMENGVPTAANHGGPRFNGELFRYEKVVELNTDDGNPESVLHQARIFTMDENGVFYVADAHRHRVAVFDPDGNYLRSIGQEGDGPGDLRNPFNIDIIDGPCSRPWLRRRSSPSRRSRVGRSRVASCTGGASSASYSRLAFMSSSSAM